MVGIKAWADGLCGDGVTWYLSGGTLTICKTHSGTGTMDNYTNLMAPWSGSRKNIKTIIIKQDVRSIGYGAFYDCSNLSSVTIPNSVFLICGCAFYKCSGLTSVTIPNSVETIVFSAFRECSGLTSIVVKSGNTKYDSRDNCNAIIETASNKLISGCKNTVIPNSVTSIGQSAFEGCSGLTSVTIPNSVTSIDGFAFKGCSNLTSVTLNSNTIASKAYTSSSNLKSIFGNQVTEYIIGDNVTSIGDYAFSGCSGLTSIVVKSGNTKYDSRDNCNAIIETASNKLISGCKNTVIPNSVTSIGQSAFEGCSGLTSVTIPNSVTSIDGFAFKGCSNLTSVTLNSNTIASKAYTSSSNLKSIFGNQVTEYIIGDNVTSIGDYAFSGCSGLTSVTIPNSVTSIGDNAFCDCSGLTSVTVLNPTPVGITQDVFTNRVKATLYVPKGSKSAYQAADYWKEFKEIIEIEIPFQVDGLYYYLDTDNHQAQVTYKTYKPYGLYTGSITIPSSITYDDISYDVTSIGSSVFEGCSSLTSITIPNSVTSIGGSAFYGCSGLTSVTIPNSVTSIGDGAFSGCSSLTTVTLNSNDIVSASYDHWDSFRDIFGEQVKEYIIGDDVTSIGEWAFYGCSNLTSITIGNSVTSIDEWAFRDCSGLTTVTLNSNDIVSASYDHWDSFRDIFGEQVKEYIIGDEVTRIGKSAFEGCSNLTSITIPNSVTSIGEWAFRDCSGLTTVTLNSNYLVSASYDYDPRYRFNYIFGDQVKNYIIGDEVTRIGKSAFEGCSNLTSITIPNSVTSIGEGAFRGCSSLTSITIPNNVRSIGDRAFAGCSGFTSVTIPNSVTEIGWSAFYGCSSLATFYCDGNNLTDIGGGAFSGTAWYNNHPDGLVYFCQVAYNYKGEMPANTSITLNEGTIVIASSAFSGCTGLTSITIPNSVTSIGEEVFSGCTGLTSVTIGNNVTSIGDYAFYGCSGLTSITIPNSVTSIGSGAFYDCSALTSVTALNPTPVAINQYVFTNRTNATLYVPKGSKSAYQVADYWKEFKEIVEIDPSGIDEISIQENGFDNINQEGAVWYSIDGKRASEPQRGLNIIRMKDGTTRKVVVK